MTEASSTDHELLELDKRLIALVKQEELSAEAAARLCDRYGEKAVIECLVACCTMLHERSSNALRAVINELQI